MFVVVVLQRIFVFFVVVFLVAITVNSQSVF